jgi:predicted dehydrogenase
MKEAAIHRRNFLKTTGLFSASLALGLPGVALSDYPFENDPIRIGVIGTGSRGSGLIRVMQEIPQLSVLACCDILPFRLENGLAHADSNAKGYSDYRALLDAKDIDAVLIATPLYLHAQMAIEALEAGKHVYCEKTMAYNEEQALRMVDKAQQHPKLTFQVGHQYHSSRLYYKIVELIQNGYIGTVTGFECQWNRNGDWRRKVPHPKYERIINWRMYREYSCGLLGELSAHQIDFVNWVTQSHPVSVVGTGGIDYWKDGRETYDNVHVIFDYPKGIKASFTCTTANAYEGYQIKVLGDQATLVIKPDRAWIYPEKVESEQETALVDGVSGATKSTLEEYGAIPINVEHTDPSKQALLDFADNIMQHKVPLSNVKSGAEVSFAVQMALRSISEKRSIAWKY